MCYNKNIIEHIIFNWMMCFAYQNVMFQYSRKSVERQSPRNPDRGFHVEMMGFLGMGNNPMVGATVAVAVAVEESFK